MLVKYFVIHKNIFIHFFTELWDLKSSNSERSQMCLLFLICVRPVNHLTSRGSSCVITKLK